MLENDLALVTGASRGIGRAIALALAGAGAQVIGTSTSENGASTFGEFWLLDILSSPKKQRSKAVRCNEARIEVIAWFHRPWYVLPGTGA